MNRRKAISGLGALIGGSMIGSPLYANGLLSEADTRDKKVVKSVRKRVVLSDNWQFQIDVKDIGERDRWFEDKYDRTVWEKVSQVPQAWDCYEDALWEYEGVGWYSTILNSGDFIVGKRVELIFNRVMYYSKVWLNGNYIGENIGGYLPFSFDVTQYLNSGKDNKLVVRVDNKPRIEWLPAAEQIEWIQYGGLLEPVELVSTSPVYIEDFVIATTPEKERAQINCSANIVNQTDALSDMELNIVISRGGYTVSKKVEIKCKANESTKIDVALKVDHADLWSPESPALYKATASLKKGNQIIDDRSEEFGIREVSVEGTSILLNGKPIIIKGAHRYDAMGRFGPTPPEKLVREDLSLMKSVGINLIRVHYPASPEFLSLLDEYGFLMMEEIPLNWWGQTNHKGLKPIGGRAPQSLDILPQAKSALTKMIKRDKNHPCIIIWSMANECVTDNEIGIKVMRELLKLGKLLDSTRLRTFVTSGDPTGHLGFDEADIICFNKYVECDYIQQMDSVAYLPLIKDLTRYRDFFVGKPIVMSEYGRQGIKNLHGNVWATEEYQAAYIKSMWKALEEDRTISGGILWTWADYFHERHYAVHASYGPYGVVTGDRKQKASLKALAYLYEGAMIEKY